MSSTSPQGDDPELMLAIALSQSLQQAMEEDRAEPDAAALLSDAIKTGGPSAAAAYGALLQWAAACAAAELTPTRAAALPAVALAALHAGAGERLLATAAAALLRALQLDVRPALAALAAVTARRPPAGVPLPPDVPPLLAGLRLPRASRWLPPTAAPPAPATRLGGASGAAVLLQAALRALPPPSSAGSAEEGLRFAAEAAALVASSGLGAGLAPALVLELLERALQLAAAGAAVMRGLLDDLLDVAGRALPGALPTLQTAVAARVLEGQAGLAVHSVQLDLVAWAVELARLLLPALPDGPAVPIAAVPSTALSLALAVRSGLRVPLDGTLAPLARAALLLRPEAPGALMDTALALLRAATAQALTRPAPPVAPQSQAPVAVAPNSSSNTSRPRPPAPAAPTAPASADEDFSLFGELFTDTAEASPVPRPLEASTGSTNSSATGAATPAPVASSSAAAATTTSTERDENEQLECAADLLALLAGLAAAPTLAGWWREQMTERHVDGLLGLAAQLPHEDARAQLRLLLARAAPALTPALVDLLLGRAAASPTPPADLMLLLTRAVLHHVASTPSPESPLAATVLRTFASVLEQQVSQAELLLVAEWPAIALLVFHTLASPVQQAGFSGQLALVLKQTVVRGLACPVSLTGVVARLLLYTVRHTEVGPAPRVAQALEATLLPGPTRDDGLAQLLAALDSAADRPAGVAGLAAAEPALPAVLGVLDLPLTWPAPTAAALVQLAALLQPRAQLPALWTEPWPATPGAQLARTLALALAPTPNAELLASASTALLHVSARAEQLAVPQAMAAPTVAELLALVLARAAAAGPAAARTAFSAVAISLQRWLAAAASYHSRAQLPANVPAEVHAVLQTVLQAGLSAAAVGTLLEGVTAAKAKSLQALPPTVSVASPQQALLHIMQTHAQLGSSAEPLPVQAAQSAQLVACALVPVVCTLAAAVAKFRQAAETTSARSLAQVLAQSDAELVAPVAHACCVAAPLVADADRVRLQREVLQLWSGGAAAGRALQDLARCSRAQAVLEAAAHVPSASLKTAAALEPACLEALAVLAEARRLAATPSPAAENDSLWARAVLPVWFGPPLAGGLGGSGRVAALLDATGSALSKRVAEAALRLLCDCADSDLLPADQLGALNWREWLAARLADPEPTRLTDLRALQLRLLEALSTRYASACATRLLDALEAEMPRVLEQPVPSAVRNLLALAQQLAGATGSRMRVLEAVLRFVAGLPAELGPRQVDAATHALRFAAKAAGARVPLPVSCKARQRAVLLAALHQPPDPAATAASERALAARCCSYVGSGPHFVEQHWYFCYTCGLTFAEGVCSVCVRVCHKGHDVSYSRRSRFFCDCGHGTRGQKCKALHTRESASAEQLPTTTTASASGESDSALAVTRLAAAHESLLSVFGRATAVLAGLTQTIVAGGRELLSGTGERTLSSSIRADLLEARRHLKAGALDARVRWDSVAHRELRGHLQSGAVVPARMPLACGPRGLVLAIDGGALALADLSRLLDDKEKHTGGALDKTAWRALDKSNPGFDILSIALNPINLQHTAAAGARDVHVYRLSGSPASQLVQPLALDLRLELLDSISAAVSPVAVLRLDWLPSSQVRLAVLTTRAWLLFDLAQSLQPLAVLCPPNPAELFRDCALVPAVGAAAGARCPLSPPGLDQLLVLQMASGELVSCPLPKAVAATQGSPSPLQRLSLPAGLRAKGGAGLHFWRGGNCLLLAFEDALVAGRLNSAGTALETYAYLSKPPAASPVPKGPSGGLTPALPVGSSQFVELPDYERGLLLWSRKANALHVLWPSEATGSSGGADGSLQLLVSAVKLPNQGSAKVEGVALLPLQSADTGPVVPAVATATPRGVLHAVLVLLDDGALHRLERPPLPAPPAPPKESSVPKAKGTPAAAAAAKARFPVDYFETLECVTPRVDLAGDVLLCYSNEQAKRRLAANDGYVVSPHVDRFEIRMRNPQPETHVLAGVRVLVGHASRDHTPRQLRVGSRVVDVVEGQRRWYDIALPTEDLLIDKGSDELVLFASACFVAGNAPLIDSLEVYAQTKHAFGYDERLRALQLLAGGADTSLNTSLSGDVLSALQPRAAAEQLAVRALQLLTVAPPPPQSPTRAVLLAALQPLLVAEATPPALCEAAKALLLALSGSRADYLRAKDSARLQHAWQRLSGPVPAAELIALLSRVARIASRRLANYTAHLLGHEPTLPARVATAVYDLLHSPAHPVDAASILALPAAAETVERCAEHLAAVLCGGLQALATAPSELSSAAAVILLNQLVQLLLSPLTPLRVAVQQALGDILAPLPGGSASEYSCDACRREIGGVRWHCAECADFDLCEPCHTLAAVQPGSAHSSTHSMVRHAPDTPAGLVDQLAEHQLEALAADLSLRPLAAPAPAAAEVQCVRQRDAALMRRTVAARVMAELSPDAPLLRSKLAAGQLDSLFALLLQLVRHVTPVEQTEEQRTFVRDLVQRLSGLLRAMLPAASLEVPNEAVVHTLTLLARLAAPEAPADPKAPASAAHLWDRATSDLTRVGLQTVAVEPLLLALLERLDREVLSNKARRRALFRPDPTAVAPPLLVVRSAEELAAADLPPLAKDKEGDSGKAGDGGPAALLLRAVLGLSLALLARVADVRRWDAVERWKSALCSVISRRAVPLAAQAEAKACLLLLCGGDRDEYYARRDAGELARELGKLSQLQGRREVGYDENVKALGCMGRMLAVAQARPGNWLRFVVGDEGVLRGLLRTPAGIADEVAVLQLQLLAAAFLAGSPRPGAAPPDPTAARELQRRVAQLLDSDELGVFIDAFLLHAPARDVRLEARNFLYWLWLNCGPTQQAVLLRALGRRIPQLPGLGRNGGEAMELLAFALGSGGGGQALADERSDVLAALVPQLRVQATLLLNHPHAHAYRSLAHAVELDGFYLESSPCASCNASLQPPLMLQKLDALRQEQKFTASAQIVKLSSAMLISAVHVKATEVKRGKALKTVNVYINQRAAADLAELRNKWSEWRRVKSHTLPPPAAGAPAHADVKLELGIPVAARNLLIEYAELYDTPGAAPDKLMCPRCNRPVTDKHGFCAQCHESAYQCRNCRNINYENLNGFLCNECGFCKHLTLQVQVFARPSLAAERIESDDELKAAHRALDKQVDAVAARLDELQQLARPLAKALSHVPAYSPTADARLDDPANRLAAAAGAAAASPASARLSRRLAQLAVLYTRDCRAAAEGLARALLSQRETQREIQRYSASKQAAATGVPPSWDRTASSSSLASMGSTSDLASMLPATAAPVQHHAQLLHGGNSCYGCALHFVQLMLVVVAQLARSPDGRRECVRRGVADELVALHAHLPPALPAAAGRSRAELKTVLAELLHDDAAGVTRLVAELKARVQQTVRDWRAVLADGSGGWALQKQLGLLLHLSALPAPYWTVPLRAALELFFESVQLPDALASPVLQEELLVPVLQLLDRLCKMPALDDPLTLPGGPLLPRANPLPSHPTVMYAAAGTADFERWRSAHQHQVLTWTHVPSVPPPSRPKDPAVPKTPVPAAASAAPASPVAAPDAADMAAARADYLAGKYWRLWKARAGLLLSASAGRVRPSPPLEPGNWLVRVLLVRGSESVRAHAASLAESLADGGGPRAWALLELLLDALPEASAAGPASLQFFCLLRRLLQPAEVKVRLVLRRDVLALLLTAVEREVERLLEAERAGAVAADAGTSLKQLVEMLHVLLADPLVRLRFRRAGQTLSSRVLGAFVALRGLLLARTKLADEAARLLLLLLNNPEWGAAEAAGERAAEQDAFVASCFGALLKAETRRDERTCIFILEQLAAVLCPQKAEPPLLLVLNKAPTQEEFIRGAMGKNPYSSADCGPLMRDVKNKICRDLDLRGLIEDNSGMELLVSGSIVKLDLPVRAVFDKLWRPARVAAGIPLEQTATQPMVITYRLQGLDGEATEPIVEELTADAAPDAEAEARVLHLAHVMVQCGGVAALAHQLRTVSNLRLARDKELAALALRLLLVGARQPAARQQMVREGLLAALVPLLKAALRDLPSAGASKDELLDQLLLVLEAVVHATNEQPADQPADPMQLAPPPGSADEDALGQMRMVLSRLDSPLLRANARMRTNLARILPHLTYGQPRLCEAFVEHFRAPVEAYMLEPVDDNKARYLVDVLAAAAAAIPADSKGAVLKDLLLTRDVTPALVGFVARVDAKLAVDEWAARLKQQGGALAQVFALLAALVRGHGPSQTAAGSPTVLEAALRMEDTASVERVPQAAEAFLDALVTDRAGCAELIVSRRREVKQRKAQQAQQKRARMLQELGIASAQGGKLKPASRPAVLLDALASLDDEHGLRCVTCQEGYSFKPQEMLGFYVFTKRLQLTGVRGGASEAGYSTVTHFNFIHFSCHRDAARADKALKQPKEEWEGAIVRNSHTKTNNLFPVWGPSLPEDAYAAAVDRFWQGQARVAKADGVRFRLLCHDLRALLWRFAREESFSVDSKGGGRESNARMLPFMLQMGTFLLDQKSGAQRRLLEKALAAFLGTAEKDWPAAAVQVDNAPFFVASALFLLSPEEWRTHRMQLVSMLLMHAFVEHSLAPRSVPGASGAGAASVVRAGDAMETELSAAGLLSVAKPYLVFAGLVQRASDLFKDPKLPLPPAESTKTAASAPGPASSAPAVPAAAVAFNTALDAAWLQRLRHVIRSDDEKAISLANQWLQTLEETLLPADSAQELLDELGLLGEVLARLPAGADAWIAGLQQRAVAHAKSL